MQEQLVTVLTAVLKARAELAAYEHASLPNALGLVAKLKDIFEDVELVRAMHVLHTPNEGRDAVMELVEGDVSPAPPLSR